MHYIETLRGVGRLHAGHRALGCVGYFVYSDADGRNEAVKLDPMPDGTSSDIFLLTLEDGRILACQATADGGSCTVLAGGPLTERRHHRRLSPVARALS